MAVALTDRDFAIEDLFTEEYYLDIIGEVYHRELQAAQVTELKLPPGGLLWRRVERALEGVGVKYNKGPAAKALRSRLVKAANLDALPEDTRAKARQLVAAILGAFTGNAVPPPARPAEPPKAVKPRGRQKKEAGPS